MAIGTFPKTNAVIIGFPGGRPGTHQGAYLFQLHLKDGLFNLAKKIVSVPHEELER